ncbi:MAG: exodeoxyribonuclease III [Beijerinckiaceae bacterium]
MRLTIATWNINSVRLRIEQVAQFVKMAKPDVLCLQETKCVDDSFPRKDIAKMGFEHVAIHGQKSYNGVAILSRLPIAEISSEKFCGLDDRRHLAVQFGKEAGAAAGIVLHNFYIPAGGDIPDIKLNPKFDHKLRFLDEVRAWSGKLKKNHRSIVVGDLNVAPLEHDVWSHKQLLDIVSHTPVETEHLLRTIGEGGWVDAMRKLTPEPEKLYSWWSYRAADWELSNRGRRLDHVWLSPALGDALVSARIETKTRGWERPSDHVPVLTTLEL